MAVVTYTPAQLQLSVGETVTVSWTSDTGLWLVLPTPADENVVAATPVENHTTYGTFTVTGVGDGTTTITIDGYNFLGVTVGTVEDESYLNKRGLTHFWGNIDTLKQDKLTAGAGIAISNNVISATGGGTADAVDWGHITGSMSNQTDLTTALAAKANSADLATVATSGSYNDLSNKPTIPTVNNATLTIQKNGTTVNTFTANASSNATANITVPTAVTDLSDASNYVTQTDIADVIRTTDVGVIKGQNIADSEITSSKIDWTTQTYTVTLGQHIESYSEVTVKSFGGIATIKGFLVTNAVVAQGEALFTISNCPDALKNQRIPTTGAAGIPYYYIDYDGKAFYDIGTVPVGNILFGATFI